MNVILVILTIFGVGYIYRYNKSSVHNINKEEPLIITDYLNNGQANLARELSRVEPFIGNIESYSGFFRVSNDCVRNMFFWYFPSQNGNTSAPLLVWLQGGPGASSLFGLLVENGPYTLDSNENLMLRSRSWTKEYSVLFIDNPVGSGFSFSDQKCYLTNEDQVGLYLSIFMHQFYQLFPNLRPNPLYITGESYAGKYIPTMVYSIHKYNQNNTTPINLIGMAIGDGLCDPYNMLNYGTYLNKIGLIFDNQMIHFDNLFHLVRQSIEKGDFYQGSIYKDEIFELFHKITGLSDVYDYYADKGVSFEPYEKFLNKNSQKLHAGNLHFEMTSSSVFEALYPDRAKSMSPTIQKVINAGYKSLFFSGQFDVIDPYPSTSAFLRNLDWNGKENFVNASQHIWYSVNGPKRVNGYYKSAGNVMQLIVRNAGHMVPMDQPEAALEMLKLFIHDF